MLCYRLKKFRVKKEPDIMKLKHVRWAKESRIEEVVAGDVEGGSIGDTRSKNGRVDQVDPCNLREEYL